jgi:mono/diheme cytochrome c family protein
MGRHVIARCVTAGAFIVLLAGTFAASRAGAQGAAPGPSLVERGKYLATIGICESCHTPKDAQENGLPGKALSGGHRVGGILASNITPDRETGIGAWSDQQIIDAIRNGKRPNGEPVRPPMGVFFYRGLSDGDVRAIVAYLRSVPAVSNAVARLDGRGPPPSFDPVQNVSAPDPKDKLALGKYLAENVAHCFQCHTPRKDGGALDLARMGAGGNAYPARGGGQAIAPNITPTRLASWTDEQIKTAITNGVRPDGGQLAPVMDFELYSKFTPDDLDALVAFVRSVPAVN